jgi:hypothetical protein
MKAEPVRRLKVLCIRITHRITVYDRTLRSMCGPGGGSPSCPIPSPHERPGRGGARRTVARRSPSAPVLIGRVGTASAPRFTNVLQRSDRPHAQTAYQRSEQLLHTPTYSRTRMDVLRTRATRGSLATSAYRTRGPLDGHLAPPSSATRRRRQVGLPAAGDTAIAAAAAAAAELPLMLPRQLVFGTRENRTSYSQKPPRSAPSVGRRADANRKRAAGRQVWRAEGRLSSGSIFRRLGLMERAGKPDECLGSTLIPQVLQSCLMLRELSSAGSGRFFGIGIR